MTRNIEIKVYLNIDEYNNAVECAKTRKMSYTTNSEMIRKILYDYSEKIMGLVDANVLIEMKLAEYKQQVAQQESVIESLQATLRQKNNEIDVVKHNLSNLKKKKKV